MEGHSTPQRTKAQVAVLAKMLADGWAVFEELPALGIVCLFKATVDHAGVRRVEYKSVGRHGHTL